LVDSTKAIYEYALRSTADGDARSRSCQVCSRSRSSNGRFRKSTAFDRNLITFMKPSGGPLTLIVAYQYPPFSTWAVSAKMHHCASVSFATFLGTFLRKISDCRNGVFNSEKYVIRMFKLYDRRVRNSNNYLYTVNTKSAYKEHSCFVD